MFKVSSLLSFPSPNLYSISVALKTNSLYFPVPVPPIAYKIPLLMDATAKLINRQNLCAMLFSSGQKSSSSFGSRATGYPFTLPTGHQYILLYSPAQCGHNTLARSAFLSCSSAAATYPQSLLTHTRLKPTAASKATTYRINSQSNLGSIPGTVDRTTATTASGLKWRGERKANQTATGWPIKFHCSGYRRLQSQIKFHSHRNGYLYVKTTP